MRPYMVLLGSAVVFTAFPAFAQNPKPNPKSIDPQTTCSATPGSNNDGSMKKKEEGGGSSALNDKLSSCGGVLKPPAVGDNMAKPAPKTGASRVITPKDLPDQQAPGAPKKDED